MDDIAIKVSGVSKCYKLYGSPGDRLKEAFSPFRKIYHEDFFALKNIDLKIKKGEILGVVGKNGCGKSTLLKLISGVLVPNEGEVVVDGKISALLELGSGFNPEFTGRQNIFFYGAIMGFSNNEMTKKLDSIIEFAEIGEFLYQPLKTYSSGMKARLGFAVAVHIEPEILIIDEVLSVGDALFQRKCYAKMEEFFNGGKTIIYVSHDADSVNRLCTRAVLISGGEIIMDSDAKAVTTHYQKILFSSQSDNEKTSSDKVGSREDEMSKEGKVQKKNIESSSNYLPDLKSLSSVKYGSDEVFIKNVRILDEHDQKVNLLKSNTDYRFLAEIEFEIDAENVSFGFEIKDIKGVRLATVESDKLCKRGVQYSIKKGDRFYLEYAFKCIFTAGMYYLNFGVSSFEGEQKVLSRIVDVLVFKVMNERGLSSGCVELVKSINIDTGVSIDYIETL